VLVAQDPIFSSIFLFVSAIFAAITNVVAENKTRSARSVNLLLPGLVALAALAIHAILSSPQNQKLHKGLLQMLSERGLALTTIINKCESGVSVISFIWAFYRSTKSLSDNTRR